VSFSLVAAVVASLELQHQSVLQRKLLNRAVVWLEEGSSLYRKCLNDAKLRATILSLKVSTYRFDTISELPLPFNCKPVTDYSCICSKQGECFCEDFSTISKHMVKDWKTLPFKILDEVNRLPAVGFSAISPCLSSSKLKLGSEGSRFDKVERLKHLFDEQEKIYNARTFYALVVQLDFIHQMSLYREQYLQSALKMFWRNGCNKITGHHIERLDPLSREAVHLDRIHGLYRTYQHKLQRSDILNLQKREIETNDHIERFAAKRLEAKKVAHDLTADAIAAVHSFSFLPQNPIQPASVQKKIPPIQTAEEHAKVLSELEKDVEDGKKRYERLKASFEKEIEELQKLRSEKTAALAKIIEDEERDAKTQREQDCIEERELQDKESMEEDRFKKLVIKLKIHRNQQLSRYQSLKRQLLFKKSRRSSSWKGILLTGSLMKKKNLMPDVNPKKKNESTSTSSDYFK
jgi:hypothetical protein